MKNTKYSNNDRENITHMIGNLKNIDHYTEIFEILKCDKNIEYTECSGQICLNMSVLTDRTLDKIVKYLKENCKQEKTKQIRKKKSVVEKKSKETKRIHKLSNYEKNILKQKNLKKILNKEEEYEDFRF